MIAEWIKEIPKWDKEYKEMMAGNLSKRQIELLKLWVNVAEKGVKEKTN